VVDPVNETTRAHRPAFIKRGLNALSCVLGLLLAKLLQADPSLAEASLGYRGDEQHFHGPRGGVPPERGHGECPRSRHCAGAAPRDQLEIASRDHTLERVEFLRAAD